MTDSYGVAFSKNGKLLLKCPTTLAGHYEIPNGVTEIDFQAFCNCSKLTSVTIPDSVKIIGFLAFHSCSSLTSISIPNGVTKIREGTFGFCSSLKEITISQSVEIICMNPFSNCINLTTINVHPDNLFFTSDQGILFNKDKTTLIYYPRGKNGSYEIPINVQIVSEKSFQDAELLTAITIPSTVTEIGDWAFTGCHSLTTITIPSGVRNRH